EVALKKSGALVKLRKTLSIAKAVNEERGFHYAFWYIIDQNARSFKRTINEILLILYSRTQRTTLVHVIGDSHAIVFKGNKPFISHHLGAATAYNLSKQESTTDSQKKLFRIINRISKKDIVMLIFGEIDCRIHAYYQFKKSNEKYSIEEILDNTITKYGEVINQIRNRGIIPCICSISPATMVGNQYNVPFYATPETRSQITHRFNQKLQDFCNKNHYPFIDIYSKVSDKKGLMLKEYAGDEIHLNSNVIPLVRTELNDKLGVLV
ncbi:MAG: hypothetical protein GY861_22925, partial [bacterium]|nr:hypothetical protein [bacterium]